jgi:hypothetical protein
MRAGTSRRARCAQKLPSRTALGALQLPTQEGGDQEPGEYEEHVHSEQALPPSTRCRRDRARTAITAKARMPSSAENRQQTAGLVARVLLDLRSCSGALARGPALTGHCRAVAQDARRRAIDGGHRAVREACATGGRDRCSPVARIGGPARSTAVHTHASAWRMRPLSGGRGHQKHGGGPNQMELLVGRADGSGRGRPPWSRAHPSRACRTAATSFGVIVWEPELPRSTGCRCRSGRGPPCQHAPASASGPPPPTMAKDIPSTACQVMALWNRSQTARERPAPPDRVRRCGCHRPEPGREHHRSGWSRGPRSRSRRRSEPTR